MWLTGRNPLSAARTTLQGDAAGLAKARKGVVLIRMTPRVAAPSSSAWLQTGLEGLGFLFVPAHRRPGECDAERHGPVTWDGR